MEQIINLDSEQLARFEDQLALPGMSESAQQKLQDAKVTVLGAGGVGSACAAYLAAAGVGHLTIIDPARIDNPDLNRHVLLNPDDVGHNKAAIVANRIRLINPHTHVRDVRENFHVHNAEELLADCDIVIDGLDDWPDKLVLSDVCMQLQKPLVHAGISVFEFHLFIMIPGRSSCLRCVFSKIGLEDATWSERHPGVLGSLSGMLGSFMATEAIKLITGVGPTSGNHLIKFDALRRYFDNVVDLGPQPDCPDCGQGRR